jgi:hypothetical protein
MDFRRPRDEYIFGLAEKPAQPLRGTIASPLAGRRLTAAAPYVGPLDYRTGAFCALGTKKLYSAYEGACVRVRRSTDNAEQDIGFLSDGNVDGATANSFKGAGTLSIVTWYDQSDNWRNWGQSTAANQPAFSADGPNSDWALTFDGSNDHLTIASTSNANPNTYYVGVNFLTWENQNYLLDSSTGDNQIIVQLNSTPQVVIYAGNVIGTTNFATATWASLTAKFNGASSELRRNKAAGATGNAGSNAPTGTNYLGIRGGATANTGINGRLNYFVWFGAADDTTAQDAAIDALAASFGISV